MADNHDIALMAHLMRRAGFGEQHTQLQERAATATRPRWKSFCTRRTTITEWQST